MTNFLKILYKFKIIKTEHATDAGVILKINSVGQFWIFWLDLIKKSEKY